jgi:hypothetical protein
MVLINWEDLGQIRNHKYYLNKQEKKDYINITIQNKEEYGAPMEIAGKKVEEVKKGEEKKQEETNEKIG